MNWFRRKVQTGVKHVARDSASHLLYQERKRQEGFMQNSKSVTMMILGFLLADFILFLYLNEHGYTNVGLYAKIGVFVMIGMIFYSVWMTLDAKKHIQRIDDIYLKNEYQQPINRFRRAARTSRKPILIKIDR